MVALISMVCWDHPRIRGTNTLQSFFYSFPLGSPPHTRDKFEVEVIAEIADRITPAYAGQITSRVQGGGSNRDHPRIRGTNLTSAHSLSPVPGSPPHTRDKFFRLSEGREGERITPAYAGQILKFSIRMMESQDHPRIRGTNFSNSSTLLYPLGSPPHTRDKCQARRLKARSPRITPAYAGQITCEDVEARYREDHPRIRGTNRTGDQRGATAQGSPPHTRDKYRLNTDSFVSSRITPAYAGQMLSMKGLVNTSRGSPPHTRDKCVVFSSVVVPCRIIPAYAGLMFTNG